nr:MULTISPECIES: hypothetical protein [unclassified Janthinobacterium]
MANIVFHTRGVSCSTNDAGCWPTRCNTSTRWLVWIDIVQAHMLAGAAWRMHEANLVAFDSKLARAQYCRQHGLKVNLFLYRLRRHRSAPAKPLTNIPVSVETVPRSRRGLGLKNGIKRRPGPIEH